MRIKGHELDIDFLVELEDFTFDRMRIKGNKLQSCSPFRSDRHPSFAVNLDNGTWIDSGSDQDHMKKGNFTSLLAYLRSESYEDAETYLLDKYCIDFKDVTNLELKLKLPSIAAKDPGATIEYLPETLGSPYLRSRGISESTAIFFGVSETVINNTNVVAMPWRDPKGKLINIKYRSITDKVFFYEENGSDIKPYMFGIYQAMKKQPKDLWLVESEIDVMYLHTCGITAIAFGRASVNDKQLQQILLVGAENIIIAVDNDSVGKSFADVLVEELLQYSNLWKFIHEKGKKDVNDATIETLKTPNLNKVNLLKVLEKQESKHN